MLRKVFFYSNLKYSPYSRKKLGLEKTSKYANLKIYFLTNYICLGIYNVCAIINHYYELIIYLSADFNSFLKFKLNNATVVHTAKKSAIGSASNTAITLLLKNIGSINISGISSITFLNIARNADILALPKATNVC